MIEINDSNLLTTTKLKEFFVSFPEWKVFWSSIEEVFFKNYWNNWDKLILTPIVFEINVNWKRTYAWKLITLDNKNTLSIDIYEWLLEADNLLLLMSYLIKDYLQKMFGWITNEMTFKEIALLLWDKQFVVWERIRQLLVTLCNDLEYILDKNFNNENK